MKNNFRIVLNIDNVGYEYDSESIQNITVQQSLGSQISKPSYGITSQTANIKLIDKDKSIFYILKNNSKTKINVDIYLNNNIIAHYVSDNISYKYSDSITTISLSDDMMKLKNFTTPYYKLGGIKEIFNETSGEVEKSGEPFPLSTLISTLFSDTLNIIGSNYILSIDPFTQDIINNIYLNGAYLEQDTYWKNWNKIAQCGLFNIYLSGNKFIIRRVI